VTCFTPAYNAPAYSEAAEGFGSLGNTMKKLSLTIAFALAIIGGTVATTGLATQPAYAEQPCSGSNC
jgi:hypothetical protein